MATGDYCPRCRGTHDILRDCPPVFTPVPASEEALLERCRILELLVMELEKKLSKIESAVCRMCRGSGEFGLADGEIPCPDCGGSGDPTKPGVFAQKPKKPKCEHRRASHSVFVDLQPELNRQCDDCLVLFSEKRICEHVFVNYQCEKCGIGQEVEKPKGK